MEGVVDGSASDMSSEESVCASCDDQCYFLLFDDVKETNLFTDIFVVSCSGDEGCASWFASVVFTLGFIHNPIHSFFFGEGGGGATQRLADLCDPGRHW